jgi:hypothetical protein
MRKNKLKTNERVVKFREKEKIMCIERRNFEEMNMRKKRSEV